MADFDGLYKTGDGAALRFYEEPKQNNFASERCGRPIYDSCLMVEVITPGSRESAPVFELERVFAEEVGIPEPRRSAKFQEYKPQIDAYRSGNDSKDMRGTPLEAWPAINVHQAAACKHAGIFTVEALSLLPDSRYSALGPGALSLVNRAKAFLDAASGNAAGEALAAANAVLEADKKRLETDVTGLNTQLTEALARIAQLEAGGGGSPPSTVLPPPEPLVEPPAVKQVTKAAKQTGGNSLEGII